MKRIDISKVVGKHCVSARAEGDTVILSFTDGAVHLFHEQDCCESVVLESADDLFLLEDSVILHAEHAEHVSNQEDGSVTFYKFHTTKGGVTLRWSGESNGYHSEEVDVWEEQTQ